MKSIPQHTLDYIDSWLELRSKWDDTPGFSVAIAKDGEILFNKAYGVANIADKTKLTTDHVFRIASHSKTFTATSLMQLQEQDKLRIDDVVVTYLPWLEDHSDERWQSVTIRELMSHSAGVIRDGLDSMYWQIGRPFPDRDQLHKEILETDLIIEPNTRLKYSNFGYALLGEVIEKASGLPYNDYVKKNIIEPLGLKNTYPEIEDDMIDRLPTGYSRMNINRERYVFPHLNTRAMSSATGFCSTTEDLCTYFAAHIVGSGKLLSDASKKEMQRQQWEFTGENRGYGLGLNIDKVGNRKPIGHGGGFPGFVTKSSVDPKDGIVVIVFSNCHGASSTPINKTIYKFLDEFGDEPPKDDQLKFEGRFSSQYGVMDIIAHAGGVRAIYPNSWSPLEQIDKLSVVDDNTLKVEETQDADNLGELIKYFRDGDGKITHIIDCGGVRRSQPDGDLIKTWE
jgi:D-alanyl-D-alanine carboxypeptidase